MSDNTPKPFLLSLLFIFLTRQRMLNFFGFIVLKIKQKKYKL
jgi:hypothetical protein